MNEQEQQNNFIKNWGKAKCEQINNLWNNTYPTFCSIPYGCEIPKNHTKEEVFKERAKKDFSNKMIREFLNL
jgi:hypothetical protein